MVLADSDDDDDDDDVAVIPDEQPVPILAQALRPGPPRGARIFRFPSNLEARAEGRPHLENCSCAECKDCVLWWASLLGDSSSDEETQSTTGDDQTEDKKDEESTASKKENGAEQSDDDSALSYFGRWFL